MKRGHSARGRRVHPRFTDFAAAIEEASFLRSESAKSQHYAVVQRGEVLRVVIYRRGEKHVWSTRAAKMRAEWLSGREAESLLQQKPENL